MAQKTQAEWLAIYKDYFNGAIDHINQKVESGQADQREKELQGLFQIVIAVKGAMEQAGEVLLAWIEEAEKTDIYPKGFNSIKDGPPQVVQTIKSLCELENGLKAYAVQHRLEITKAK